MTAVQLDDGIPIELPGSRQLKVCADAHVPLKYDSTTVLEPHSRSDKHSARAAQGFHQLPIPQEHIYLLAEGKTNEVERPRPQEALVELVRHSYTVRLLEATKTASFHFRQCASLANRLPVCRLKRQRSLAALPDLARFVEEDLAQAVCR